MRVCLELPLLVLVVNQKGIVTVLSQGFCNCKNKKKRDFKTAELESYHMWGYGQ